MEKYQRILAALSIAAAATTASCRIETADERIERLEDRVAQNCDLPSLDWSNICARQRDDAALQLTQAVATSQALEATPKP